MIQNILRLTVIFSTISIIATNNSLADEKKNYSVAMITGTGGLGDQSFNDEAYGGLLLAHFNLNVDIKAFETTTTEEFSPKLITAGEEKYNLILGASYLMTNNMKAIAKVYPKSRFVLLDSSIAHNNLKNLYTIQFKAQEAAYLAGILAGNLTSKYSKRSPKLNKKKVLGIIMGKYIPPIEAYAAGYIAGVRSVDPSIKVIIKNIKTFNSKHKGRDAGISLIKSGVDIILPVAGGAGLGAIELAKKKNILIIGVDKDQNSQGKNTVLTSIQKNISSKVSATIKMSVNGTKIPQALNFGLKDNGVQLSSFHALKTIVPQKIITQIAIAKKNIINGKIKVPTTIKQAIHYHR